MSKEKLSNKGSENQTNMRQAYQAGRHGEQLPQDSRTLRAKVARRAGHLAAKVSRRSVSNVRHQQEVTTQAETKPIATQSEAPDEGMADTSWLPPVHQEPTSQGKEPIIESIDWLPAAARQSPGSRADLDKYFSDQPQAAAIGSRRESLDDRATLDALEQDFKGSSEKRRLDNPTMIPWITGSEPLRVVEVDQPRVREVWRQASWQDPLERHTIIEGEGPVQADVIVELVGPYREASDDRPRATAQVLRIDGEYYVSQQNTFQLPEEGERPLYERTEDFLTHIESDDRRPMHIDLGGIGVDFTRRSRDDSLGISPSYIQASAGDNLSAVEYTVGAPSTSPRV